jgi:ammonia channel protein AmtB
MAATFSKNTPLYELVYVAFQATFAAITCCLILGSVVERMKFSAVLLVGLRVQEEEEREGLDITSHGERAYDL